MLRASFIGRGLITVLAVAVLAVAIAGCGSEPLGDDAAPEAPAEPGDAGAAQTDAESFEFGNESDLDRAGAPAEGDAGGEGGSLPIPQLVDRKIIRTATLELEVEDVGAAVQQVESAAAAAGGFVSQSSVFIEDPSEPEREDDGEPTRTQTATITIRVPAEAYQSVMNQLRGIAVEVTSENSSASEVTEEYTDLEARLRNLEATEVGYLDLLDKAETIPDILTVQDRINSVRLEIERVQGRINVLDSLTDLATITVQLAPPTVPAEESDSGQGWAREAWDASWEASKDTMVALGTVAIVGGVVLAWLAIPALVALAAWRLFGWRLLGPRPPRGGETGGTGTPA